MIIGVMEPKGRKPKGARPHHNLMLQSFVVKGSLIKELYYISILIIHYALNAYIGDNTKV